MERKERRRKLNDSLKQMLFPPPPPQEINIEELLNSNPHHIFPDELGEQRLHLFSWVLKDFYDADELGEQRLLLFSWVLKDFYDADELGELGAASSGDDERECGSQKPTRAQRKRVRKKKLKEDSERRNGMIGPLTDARDGAEGVRRNADKKLSNENGPPGEAPCTNQSKLKQRRRAKKLAKEKSNPSTAEKSHQDCENIGKIES